MGVATTSYMTARKPRETHEFLEYCHSLGAGGIQAALSSTEPAYLKKLRARAEELGMYVEVMADLHSIEPHLAAAREAGAVCVRSACLGGRRYESFSNLEDWRTFAASSKAAINRAVPLAEKHRIPLAIENHKDWTVDELLPILKEHQSLYFGVCLDTGNNISLLDDPMTVVERLAPYAVSTHIKDMAVEPWRDGFLLSEVPLGEGMLDMKRIVAAIRAARPNTRMTLEMITRNPLQVPCLTDKYWVTFADRNGRYLADTLRMVRDRARHVEPLPTNMDAQLRLEEENVKKSLRYAREQLDL